VTRLLIIGPPGSGKGTQAEKLALHFGIPAVSTGDIFRTNVSEETELGNQAAGYLDDAISSRTSSPTRWSRTACWTLTCRRDSCWTAIRGRLPR
jgi:cytidylate kinase